ncbi:hypothetical protein CDAR_1951 [Caerostris darwini]|uniref:G-protein coupled receptors family 1 profile domain-containing protein n=1 Tax=Caerostris darwini TaxID=1538125 RepID=A0AAV4R8T5_9ARAC|nr:hypothetical protein CDAR_1951 [Caerostris darwini]
MHTTIFLSDSGLCSVSSTPNHGCSYAFYLLFCLILPPISVISLNAGLTVHRLCKRSRRALTPKRNIACGNSHILSAEKEVLSFVIFLSLLIILSVPRSVFDVANMCGSVEDLMPAAIFSIYFLDSLLGLLLPVIVLGLHPQARVYLRNSLRRRGSISSDIDMTIMNV